MDVNRKRKRWGGVTAHSSISMVPNKLGDAPCTHVISTAFPPQTPPARRLLKPPLQTLLAYLSLAPCLSPARSGFTETGLHVSPAIQTRCWKPACLQSPVHPHCLALSNPGNTIVDLFPKFEHIARTRPCCANVTGCRRSKPRYALMPAAPTPPPATSASVASSGTCCPQPKTKRLKQSASARSSPTTH